jgi:Zn-dependent alcohol dehydrogenase
MKAAVCYEIGKPLVWKRLISIPAEGEVKVKMAAVAICHSDVRQIEQGNMGTCPSSRPRMRRLR